MKHDEYVGQVYALLDDFLTPEEEEEIREHMETCDSCMALYRKLGSDNQAVEEGVDSIDVSSDFGERVLASLPRFEQEPLLNRTVRWITGFAYSKRFAYAAAASILLLTSVVWGSSVLNERASRFGKVSRVMGLAWYKRGGRSAMLKSGDVLRCGDEIFTDKDAKITILTRDIHLLTMNEATHLVIGERGERQRLSLEKGEVFIDSEDTGRKYIVSTPSSEIRDIGTKFDVRVTPAQLIPSVVYVAVEKGKAVVATGSGNSVDVGAGEKVILVDDEVLRASAKASLDEIMKWRWRLLKEEDMNRTGWKAEDPFTGVVWAARGRGFVLPEDKECEDYPVFQQLASEIYQRLGYLGQSIEADSIAFAEKHIYIGSPYGIFRYNRGPKTMSLIVPDYGIVGAEIVSIKVSDDGNVFDLEFKRPGSDLVEHMTANLDTSPMILNLDPLTLKPVASL